MHFNLSKHKAVGCREDALGYKATRQTASRLVWPQVHETLLLNVALRMVLRAGVPGKM